MDARWLDGFDAEMRPRVEALLDDPRWPASCAAFDADGTLWAGDVGELLLQALIGLGRVPANAFARYHALMLTDPPGACAYCLEVMAGVRLDELERWSTELVGAGHHGPAFEVVQGLALELLRRGAEVFVISGSNVWTVRAGLREAGLDAAQILAVSGPEVGGVLTGEVTRPVPSARGKVDALLGVTDRPLRFAAGNAAYDLELLTHAEIALAVGPRGEETPLLKIARERGWLTVRAG